MKRIVIVIAVIVSFVAMSFKPKPVATDNMVTKINNSNLTMSLKNVNAENASIPPTVAVTVALAETSYAATVAATAAALNWLFGNTQETTQITNEYKAILKDIDLHSLDNK